MRSIHTPIAASLVSVLLYSSAITAAPWPRIKVDIVFSGRPMPRLLEATAVKEATLIWAQYGVDLIATNPDTPCRDGAIAIAVVLVDHPESPVPDSALGSIVFVEGGPGSQILMYPNAIVALVSTATVLERSEPEWPTMLRHVVLGRVLGRALAHEIGHFLLRSRDHSTIGLMRARQSVADLVAPERNRFTLSQDEGARLRSVRSAASQ
jgi:hypothetical protein